MTQVDGRRQKRYLWRLAAGAIAVMLGLDCVAFWGAAIFVIVAVDWFIGSLVLIGVACKTAAEMFVMISYIRRNREEERLNSKLLPAE